MKTVILAGGLGTRLSEETMLRPKPMVEVGGHPMLWHIMHIYAAHGYEDFIVACGYKGEVIKEYFLGFDTVNSDVEIDLGAGSVTSQRRHDVRWTVACVDTGLESMTGGRLKALEDKLSQERFMVTYGDGVADIDIRALVEFHESHGRLATVTAVHPPARFGTMELSADDVVESFQEKNQSREGWINGGFFVFEPEVLSYIDSPATRLEAEPLSQLASEGQLSAYRHSSFWQPMDTLREKNELDRMWRDGVAPWRVWPS